MSGEQTSSAPSPQLTEAECVALEHRRRMTEINDRLAGMPDGEPPVRLKPADYEYYCDHNAAIDQMNRHAARLARYRLFRRIADGLFAIIALFLIMSLVYTSAHAATLRWTAPTTNTDNSPLTDLAGFKIKYGSASTNLNNVVTINSPTATTTSIDLPPGTFYFALSAFNKAGVESVNSNTISFTQPVVPPPATIPAPPSGPAVVGRTVYQLIQQSDKLIFLPVGTVSTSVACMADFPVGEYHVVPREAVKWYGTVKPLVVVTKCN